MLAVSGAESEDGHYECCLSSDRTGDEDREKNGDANDSLNKASFK